MPTIRCPACGAKLGVTPNTSGQVWCTSCDEVFVVPAATPAPLSLDDEPLPLATDDRPRRTPAWLLVGVGMLVMAGLGVAGYFALKKDPPAQAAAEPKPAPEPKKDSPNEIPKEKNPPAPVKVEPPKTEPEKPKPPTLEDMLPRLKAATAYIRVTHGPGLVGSGTGFFAGSPGYVVTNAHVVGYGPREVRPARKIEVVVASGEKDERTLTGRLYGVDQENDLALIRVEADNLPAPLQFGRAADLIETQEVVIFGYPFGELLGKNISVNRSTVSSLRREKGTLVVVQLAGGLNPGNSGGPVTNNRGEVIGVSVAKLRGADTIAFAIPAEVAWEFVKDQLRSGGRIGGEPVATRPDVVKPPVTPPANTPPLNIPPVNPVPITPAPATVAGTEVKLPAEADQVCVGGGGRFLLMSLPRVKLIAVFDASQAKVVKYLPAPAEQVLIAAGMDKLMVVDPGTNIIQRWNLTTLEKEVTATLPTAAGLTTTAIAMGSATNGPLLVQALDWPRTGEWYVFDLTTMKEIKPRHESRVGIQERDKVRASNDGRTIIVNRERGGASILTMSGAKWTEAHTPWHDRWPVFPSPDGNTVYGMGDMCTPGGKRLGQASGGYRYYVPALHGPLVLAITDKADRHDTNRGFSLAVHAPRDTRPMFHLPAFEAIRTLFVPNVGWQIDSHVFFIPQAKVVAVLPRPADKIVLYKVDVDTELAKSDLDYLFVASQPAPAVPGKRFEYPIDARAKKGGLKYKLEFGPDGLVVGADGKVTWDVPADFTRPESVAVTISDASGQEMIHSFELVPAAK